VFKEIETGQMIDVTPPSSHERENLYTASYRAELAHFVRCARDGEPAPLPYEQADIMRIVEAAYRSYH
jgi:predicted dehydrogenase